MRLLILYYSQFGHIHRMAEAEAQGARSVSGTEVVLMRVPETLPQEVLEKTGATAFQKEFAKVPICTPRAMTEFDAIIFGTPTRFGNMCGQMRQFFDATGGIWKAGALVGKVGSVFTSSGTQHGGQESTILSVHTTLLHHGMIIVGLPYTFEEQTRTDGVMGCSPYGASTIVGNDGKRWPTESELAGARYQGRHVAEIATKLTQK